MQILITIALIIIGVLLFELIIFAHEFGHFITAKLSGVKVNEFALGMGPKLFSFKKGDTSYSLRLFPIGGYCAMEGEDEDSPEPGAFNNAKIWKRMIIIVAGAAMNFILGFILMFTFTVQTDEFASTTVSVFPPNSYSANCGLKSGDTIIDVNGYSVWNMRDLQFGISTLPLKEVDGTSLEVYKQDCANSAYKVYYGLASDNELEGEKAENFYSIISKGNSKIFTAKDKAQAKEQMTKVCKELYSFLDIKDYSIPEIKEEDTRKRYVGDVTVIRNNEQIKLNNVQFYTYYASEEDKKADKPKVSLDFYVNPEEKNFGTVLSHTVSETGSMAKSVWTSLVWLVQGKFSFTDLSGPVGIASAVTQVASQGLENSFAEAVNNILFVMILITVNLGIVNMLPFPALDGGRFVLLIIEAIFRKPIPRKAEKAINGIGLAILLLFILVVSCKDIWQLLTNTMPGM